MLIFFHNRRQKRRAGRRKFTQPLQLKVRSLLSALVPGFNTDGRAPIVLPELNGQELLAVSVGEASTNFYTTDGTAGGTVQYAELPVVISSPLDEYIVNNGELLFAVNDPNVAGAELWKTDGTAAGTSLM